MKWFYMQAGAMPLLIAALAALLPAGAGTPRITVDAGKSAGRKKRKKKNYKKTTTEKSESSCK